MFVEADLQAGVRRVDLRAYSGYHCRICRPVGLSASEVDQVISYAIGHVGHAYDTRNIVDLARYLLPTPPVPTSWRRKMISLGSGDPTRAICSGLVAQSFEAIGYPVLPDMTYFPSTSEQCPGCIEEVMHVRHHSLFVPRDFDVPPYFQIVKPSLLDDFNLRTAFGLFPFGGESGIFSGMTQDLPPIAVHRTGEQSTVALGGAAAAPQPLVVDSFAGSVRVEWDHATAFTPLGQLPFFIDFLKTAGLFDSFVADSPLNYESPNASKTRDVLGTAMLSMLAGHKRYSHIAALRGDGVLPELLGMRKIVSEDSVRRAFAAIEEKAGAAWMRRHLDHCLEPLLSEPWILDIDTTVKPLYGRQEGAVVGYNPKKPGRPSHCYHTYSMAGTRLVFDVDVCAGDEHASNHAAPALWALLDRTARDCWPTLLRGDKGFGNEKIMREAELRALAYLFKLRLTANVRRAIERLSQQSEWVDSGQGWQAKETQVRLKGWSRQRRIIVLRRRVKGELATPSTDEAGQRRLTFVDILPSEELWEYQVLVTSLVEQVGSFGQLYRDRADGENIFDELKNQWGWGGFVTQDLARCRLAARMVALFYDWWNIFVRLAEPDWHREAITSRPLLLHAIAERVRHARQTTIRIASMHARSVPAAEALRAVAKFLRGLVETAEQLAPLHRWREILSRAFQAFLKGRPLRAPLRLKPG